MRCKNWTGSHKKLALGLNREKKGSSNFLYGVICIGAQIIGEKRTYYGPKLCCGTWRYMIFLLILIY